MVTDVQSEYRHIQRGIASTSTNVEGYAGRVISEVCYPNLDYVNDFADGIILQITNLANVTTAYHKAANTDLSSIQQSTRSLVEQGTRDDTPTGLTPRKRVWEYVDEWELTQSREVVLKAWRQRSSSNAGSDTFTAEHVALMAEDTEEDDAHDVEAMMVEASPQQSSSGELTPESPVAVSLASSISSTSVPASIRPPIKKTMSKIGVPTLGTLTDRPTNVITQRGSRRVR